jgi:hypothetical protein
MLHTVGSATYESLDFEESTGEARELAVEEFDEPLDAAGVGTATAVSVSASHESKSSKLAATLVAPPSFLAAPRPPFRFAPNPPAFLFRADGGGEGRD